jgi:hypothetical protein
MIQEPDMYEMLSTYLLAMTTRHTESQVQHGTSVESTNLQSIDDVESLRQQMLQGFYFELDGPLSTEYDMEVDRHVDDVREKIRVWKVTHPESEYLMSGDDKMWVEKYVRLTAPSTSVAPRS